MTIHTITTTDQTSSDNAKSDSLEKIKRNTPSNLISDRRKSLCNGIAFKSKNDIYIKPNGIGSIE